MDDSPFATLPAELRNAIYRDVVCLDQSIEFTVGEGGVKLYTIWRGRAHLKTALSLLSTCRVVRQEALSLFYGENRFYFLRLVSVRSKRSVAATKEALRGTTNRLRNWVRSIGPGAKHLQNISIALGYWPCDARRGLQRSFLQDCVVSLSSTFPSAAKLGFEFASDYDWIIGTKFPRWNGLLTLHDLNGTREHFEKQLDYGRFLLAIAKIDQEKAQQTMRKLEADIEKLLAWAVDFCERRDRGESAD